MQYLTNLYVDPQSNKLLHKKPLLPFAKRKLFKLPLLCIYFPERGSRMEFTEIKNLNYQYFKNHKPIVAGFASDEKNAIAILRFLVEQTYLEDSELDYRNYLLNRNELVTHFSEIKSFTEIVPKDDDEEETLRNEDTV